MKYDVLQCELCRRIYPETQVYKIKLDFRAVPVRVVGTVPEFYESIRAVCEFCARGIKGLPDTAAAPPTLS